MSGLGRWLVAGLLAVGLVGCSATPPNQLPDDAASLGDRLTAAVGSKSEAAFDRLFVGQTDAGIRGWIWTNLMLVPSVSFSVDGDALMANWAPHRGASGISSRVGQVACTAAGCGVSDLGPQEGFPAPIWVVQPLAVSGTPPAVVLGSAGSASGKDWLASAQAAQAAVKQAGLGGLASAWDGQLVVELPQDATAFRQLLGKPSVADYATTGALTWLEQSSPAPVAHIIVNPSTTGALTADQRTLLLTHETVHVATAAVPVVPGATWVSEGLAEGVAVAGSPATRAGEEAAAKAACAADGLTPPSDDEFGGTDAMTQTDAYAVSQVLVNLILARQGISSVEQLWRGTSSSTVPLADWSKAWCAS